MHWLLNRLSGGKFDLCLYNQEHLYRFSPKTLELLFNKAGYCINFISFDDHLWITATRYLFNRKFRTLRYISYACVNIISKFLRLENQFVMVAQKE